MTPVQPRTRGRADAPAPRGRARLARAATLLAAALLATLPALSASAQYTATVQSTDRQAIKGWGIFAGGVHNISYNMLGRSSSQDIVYQQTGMTIARVWMHHDFWSSDSNGVNDTEMNNRAILQLQQLEDRGITRYIVTTWTPPPHMKTINDPRGKVDGVTNRLAQAYEDDFVDFYCDYLQYIEDRGFPLPEMVSIQNEVLYPANWEGCVYDHTQYARVAARLRDTLDARGMQSVGIMGPESGSYSGNLAILYNGSYNRSANTPNWSEEPERDLAAVTTHGYGGVESEGGWSDEIAEIWASARASGRSTWMTEISKLGGQNCNGLDIAIEGFRRLGREQVYIPVEHWFWWLGWRNKPDDNCANITEALVTGTSNTKQPLFYAIRTLWNSVPGNGTFRVRTVTASIPNLATGGNNKVDVWAYSGPGRKVVVFVNHSTANPTINVAGLTGLSNNTARVYRVNATARGLDDGATQTITLANNTASGVYVQNRSITIVVAGDITSGNELPWTESFTAANGTTSDTGSTAWSITAPSRGVFSVQNNRFTANNTGTQGVWTSEPIDIGGASGVTISVGLAGAGSLDTTDYVRVGYRLDGGSEQTIVNDTGAVGNATVTATGLSGDSLQIIIRSMTSGSDEFYYWDNVSVTD